MRNFWIVMKMPTFSDDVEDLYRRGRTDSRITLQRDFMPKEFYLSEDAAKTACSAKASAEPMKTFAVMQINSIYETGEPTIINKKFNDQGELVIA